MIQIYDWEGSAEHKATLLATFKAEGDPHQAIATLFGVDRQAAKLANWRLAYAGEPIRHVQPLAECEGAQQNATDGAAEQATCLLSDFHLNLYRDEQCPECGYRFRDVG